MVKLRTTAARVAHLACDGNPGAGLHLRTLGDDKHHCLDDKSRLLILNPDITTITHSHMYTRLLTV